MTGGGGLEGDWWWDWVMVADDYERGGEGEGKEGEKREIG